MLVCAWRATDPATINNVMLRFALFALGSFALFGLAIRAALMVIG